MSSGKLDVAIIDYGMGNLRSVEQAVRAIAPESTIAITADPLQIQNAQRVIFPGQGAMPDCRRELEARNLLPVLIEAAQSKPFLGICLGLQFLFEESEEGPTTGLGILPGKVLRFQAENHSQKIPHMGWNQVWQTPHPQVHPLWEGIPDGSRFYFVHSYYVIPEKSEHISGQTDYISRFTCAASRDNIFSVQFHPEKSQQMGLRLLQNFLRWNGKHDSHHLTTTFNNYASHTSD